MDNFDTFEKVFRFFLSSELDENFVRAVDQNGNKKDLIRIITTFHKMRSDLCQMIIDQVGSVELFNGFESASSCMQYGSVPEKSTCILSGVELSSQDGILIAVDNSQLFTFHKRLKVIVLTFWYLLHLPNELTKEAIIWFRKNDLIVPIHAKENRITNIVNLISTHNGKMFIKRAYVRMLNAVKFVQNDMSQITVIR
jgi:hypothetical protein